MMMSCLSFEILPVELQPAILLDIVLLQDPQQEDAQCNQNPSYQVENDLHCIHKQSIAFLEMLL